MLWLWDWTSVRKKGILLLLACGDMGILCYGMMWTGTRRYISNGSGTCLIMQGRLRIHDWMAHQKNPFFVMDGGRHEGFVGRLEG